MLGIIQARMSSKRLYGKSLIDIGQIPALGHLIFRLKLVDRIKKIVVATSDEVSDQGIADYCKNEAITCYRGSLNNVMHRFLQVLIAENSPSFIRFCGDSPFLDPEIVNRAINIFEEHNPDLVTNVQVRSFPKGQSVEIISTEAFKKGFKIATTSFHKEHPTKIFYDQSKLFNVINFDSGGSYGDIQLSVDTGEDLQDAIKIFKITSGKILDWKSLVEIKKNIK
jgi:spore coat polysaccharide biosynthesis protein SpsF